MRYRLDRSVRRVGDGRILIGGSPGRVLRLTAAGAQLVDRIVEGVDIGGSRGVEALVDRLVDSGIVHPEPEAGPAAAVGARVEVVVPVRDRRDGLALLLRSLRRETPVARVVVVDDGSIEPVEQVLDADDLDEVTVLRRDRSAGPAAARNQGAASSSAVLVAFLDSDCTVTPGWLDAVVDHFDDPRVVAVAPRVAAPVGVSALARYEVAASPLDLGPDPGRVMPGTRISYVPSAALVVRADAFARAGGFDEALRVGEDVDLIWRLVADGGRVRYEPRSVVLHEVRGTARAWLAQRFTYGSSAASLDLRHPGSVAPVAASGWSTSVWVLAVAGHPAFAALVAASSMGAMVRRLPQLPTVEVLRVVGVGHLGAGRQLAHAAVRAWWPAALAGAVVSRRVRRAVALSVVVSVADSMSVRRRAAPVDPGSHRPLDPARFAALSVADDLAYGAGLWAGCWSARSFRSLLPRTSPPAARR